MRMSCRGYGLAEKYPLNCVNDGAPGRIRTCDTGFRSDPFLS
jgi:hypothetical protein